MRPFKMFFGLAIGVMLFVFLARVAFVAFIIAALMSVVYAVYRRLKDFIAFDRFGEYYIPEYRYQAIAKPLEGGVEPLFNDRNLEQRRPINSIRFIDAI